LYNAAIGVLDYFKLLQPARFRLLMTSQYSPEAALVVSGLCLASFFVVLPVCWIQLVNAVKGQTTSERFAYNSKNSQVTSRATGSSLPSNALLRGSDGELPEAIINLSDA
jgi:hypothetical protein